MRPCSRCLSLPNIFRESSTTWPGSSSTMIAEMLRCERRGVLSSLAWKDSCLVKGKIFWIGKDIKAANFAPTLLQHNERHVFFRNTIHSSSLVSTTPTKPYPKIRTTTPTLCTTSTTSSAWRRPASRQLTCRSHWLNATSVNHAPFPVNPAHARRPATAQPKATTKPATVPVQPTSSAASRRPAAPAPAPASA